MLLILWISIILFVTILHKMKLINGIQNKFLICFSIIKNCETIIWHKNGNSGKKGKTNNKMDLLNGIRVLQQIYVILFHIATIIDYGLKFDLNIINNNDDNNSRVVSIWPFGTLIVRHGLDLTFIVSGISYAKWFSQKYNNNLNKNKFKFSLKFIFTRIINILPIYYLSLYCYLILIRYYLTDKTKDISVENSCNNNWYLNVLLIQSFISTETLVINKTFINDLLIFFLIISVWDIPGTIPSHL